MASWADGRCNLARNRDLVLDSETFLCSVNPDGPSDDTVLVGRVTDASGKIIATMVNYACHPVSLGGGNKLISPGLLWRHARSGGARHWRRALFLPAWRLGRHDAVAFL